MRSAAKVGTSIRLRSSRSRTRSRPRPSTVASSLASSRRPRRETDEGIGAKRDVAARTCCSETEERRSPIVSTLLPERPSTIGADARVRSTNPSCSGDVNGPSTPSSSGLPERVIATSVTAGSVMSVATSWAASFVRVVVSSATDSASRSTWATPSRTGTASMTSRAPLSVETASSR